MLLGKGPHQRRTGGKRAELAPNGFREFLVLESASWRNSEPRVLRERNDEVSGITVES
jgi:hypothetical protein